MFKILFEEDGVWKYHKTEYKTLASAKRNKHIVDEDTKAKILDVSSNEYVYGDLAEAIESQEDDSPVTDGWICENPIVVELDEISESTETEEKTIKTNKKFKLFDIYSIKFEENEEISVKIRNIKKINDVEMYDVKIYTQNAVLKTDLVTENVLCAIIEDLKLGVLK